MSWLSYLNPLNWPKDLSKSFISQLENGLLYLLALVLNAFLTVINSIFSILISSFEGNYVFSKLSLFHSLRFHEGIYQVIREPNLRSLFMDRTANAPTTGMSLAIEKTRYPVMRSETIPIMNAGSPNGCLFLMG